MKINKAFQNLKDNKDALFVIPPILAGISVLSYAIPYSFWLIQVLLLITIIILCVLAGCLFRFSLTNHRNGKERKWKRSFRDEYFTDSSAFFNPVLTCQPPACMGSDSPQTTHSKHCFFYPNCGGAGEIEKGMENRIECQCYTCPNRDKERCDEIQMTHRRSRLCVFFILPHPADWLSFI